MSPPSQKPLPLYLRIANDLRNRISAGEFSSGALPTEKSLASQYSTTRVTVRRGLDVLIQEGLIYADRPRGHFVRFHRPMLYRPQQEFRRRPVSPEVESFLAEMTGQGREAVQTIEVLVLPPPPLVRERLRLEEGDRTVLRRSTQFLDGEPYLTSDAYFPRALVRDSDEIMSPTEIAWGANAVLAALGYKQVRTVHEFEWRMPDPTETARLCLPPGTPVVEEVLTGYTAAGTPVSCVVNYLPGDRIKMVLELERPRLSNHLTVATASPEDLDTVVALWKRADLWQEEPRTDRIRQNIEAGECFLVHDDGVVVATIALNAYADPEFWNEEEATEDALYVHWMVVSGDASGEELGGALLDWASVRAETQGKKWLRLDSWRSHQGLLDYYHAREFALVRTVTAEDHKAGALFQRPAGHGRWAGPLLTEAAGVRAVPCAD